MRMSLELGEGDAGTENTLKAMAAMVDDATDSDIVSAFARGVRARSLDYDGMMLHLFRWLRERVRYVADPPGAEHLRSPAMMIERARVDGVAQGDCDDLATLGAAVAWCLGFEVAFVLVGSKPSGPWEHVAFAVRMPPSRAWLLLDPQESPVIGRLPKQAVRHKVVPMEELRPSAA